MLPFDDFSKKTIEPILTTLATITKKNMAIRLESCILAILRTSLGCDVPMMIQSKMMTVEAKLIQVNKMAAGTA